MPVDEFRKYGHEFIDWIADYFKNIESNTVLPNIEPGKIKSKLPLEPPQKGESMDAIFSDFEKIIMPGITHWNHPDFMAYFNSTSSGPGILAEMLSATLNINGMLWKTSPAATELEEVTLNWLKKMLGFPDNFWGIIYDTASISSMHAIAAAREQLTELKYREKGMSGRNEIPKLRLYASEHAHFSIDKGIITLGIGLNGIRKIPVDDKFRMISHELQKAISEDRKNGWLPFCVVATVGTTSTTSIDPVREIGEICRKENLWLHVDAAYGGIAAVIPKMNYIFEGIEFADSIVVNPHKWMFTPIDLSAFYTTKPEILKRAFSLGAEYLTTSEDSEVINYMDYGLQLGRRFRSLKLWFIIRYFGVEGIQNRIAEHMRLANEFADWIDSHPDFERMAPTPFSVVCFRAHPKNINNEDELNTLNEKLLDEINKTGKLFLSSTKLNGKFIIRIAISSIRTKEKNIKDAQQLIIQRLNELIN
ncbi:MAG: amino acid decarboxylase [Bacteroidetes bacterium]|nr:amino acid decarboxylase [Bacteroidota bacterium]